MAGFSGAVSKEKVNLGYVGVTDFAAYKFSSMCTHRHIFWLYRHEDILFVFVLRYAHSNPFLILVNLYEVSPIHFVTMMDHHWGGSWGGGVSIYIYIVVKMFKKAPRYLSPKDGVFRNQFGRVVS